MHAILLPPGMVFSTRGPTMPFNVAILYEDFESGKRAKGLDYATAELGHDLEFRHTIWRFDILLDPRLNVLATAALAEADLLMVSCRGGEQLPAKLYVLIGKWLAGKANHKRALVVLFDCTASGTDSAVYARLANLARENELDLFEQIFGGAEDKEKALFKLLDVLMDLTTSKGS
jgi:hypothetical protein